MIDKDPIKDIFSDRLKDLEAPVNPQVWTSISSSLATGSSVASSGLSLISKVVIGTTLVAATVTGIYFNSESNSADNSIKSQKSIHKIDNLVTSSTLESKSNHEEKNLNLVDSNNQSVFNHSINVESNLKNERNSIQLITENHTPDITSNKITPVHENEIKNVHHESTSEVNNSIEQHTNPKKTESISSEISNPQEVEKLQLNLPNIFSPNGDGSNDFFFLADAEQLSDFSIAIMNMNNQVVYSTSDVHFKWDGTDQNGNILPAGKYMYIVVGNSQNNQLVRQFSYLQIVR